FRPGSFFQPPPALAAARTACCGGLPDGALRRKARLPREPPGAGSRRRTVALALRRSCRVPSSLWCSTDARPTSSDALQGSLWLRCRHNRGQTEVDLEKATRTSLGNGVAPAGLTGPIICIHIFLWLLR